MKPFQIQCTTCGTLLRVTKPEAIGLILGCPKCNSMVQIVAPEGWVVEPTPNKLETGKLDPNKSKSSAPATGLLSASSSQGAIKSPLPISTAPKKSAPTSVPEVKPVAATQNDARKTDSPKKPDTSVSPQSSATQAASSHEKKQSTSSRVAKIAAATIPAALPPLNANAATPTPIAEPPIVNGTRAAAREGISLLVPMFGAMALVMTIGVSWWLLSQLQDDPKSVAVAVSQPKTPATPADDPAKKAPDLNAADVKPQVVVVDANAAENPFAPQNNVEQPAGPANPLPIDIPVPGQLAVGAAKDPGKSNENTTNPDVQAPAQPSANPFVDDSPAGAKAQHGKLVLGPAGEPMKPSPQGVASLPPIPKTSVEKKDPGNNLIASIEPQIVPPVPENPNGPKINAPMPELERIAYTDIDLSSLEMPLGGVAYDNVPLYRVLEEISDLSRIPLHIDLKALEQNGVSVVMPVRFKATNVTVRNVLERILEPFGLALIEHAHYMIVGQIERQPAPTSSRYAIDDLAKDEQQIQADLISPIKRLVAPESWANANVETQDKTLIVTQTFDVHDQIVTWCEKLRKARGLPLQTKYDPTQSTLRRFNPARYEPTSEWSIAKSSLGKKVTAGYPRPETVSNILRHLEQQSGTAIIIDQAALDLAEFSPASTGTLSVRETSLDESLTKLLTPLGLSFMPIDDQTIIVSTLKELSNKSSIEWYPLQALMASKTVPADEEKIVPWLNQELKRTASTSSVTPELCHWDYASRTLVIKGSAILHRDLTRVLNL